MRARRRCGHVAAMLHDIIGGVHMVPEDGPYNPIFARLDTTDTLSVSVLFATPLGDALLDRVEAIACDWFAVTSWTAEGAEVTLPQLEEETLTPTCLHLAVTNVTTAREPIAALVRALVRAGVGAHQVILG